MTVGSLFSGIGGFDLGLERAGHEIVWQVENDPFCQKVLRKHWPDVPCYEDVRDVGVHNLETVDVICGGFPCQPVSIAGKRKGQDDERWLWPEYARIVREMEPRYVLMENVPGLLVRGMGDILGDLARLRYDAEWEVLSAKEAGAPHRRNRVFILAYPEGEQRDGGELYRGNRPGQISKLRDDIPEEAPESNWWSHEPNVDRVAHGVPSKVDRMRTLGNAVVPQIAELIGRRLRSHT
tara:strand:- start:344 stop:1054 length:711 start_codon:yes stop_codon:yes gene_type:complete